MTISSSEKGMMNPYSKGSENYGYKGHGPEPVNYTEAMSSNQRTSTTEMCLGNVTKTGDQENFPAGLANGGAGLGKVYQSKAGE